MKRVLTFLSIVVIIGLLTAASPGDIAPGYGRIEGHVIDAETKAPLAFANIVLVGSSKGAMSLDDGRFAVRDVRAGTYTVKAMMMGYKTVEVKNVVVKAGEVVELLIEMNMTIVSETQRIDVFAERKVTEVTSADVRASISAEQIKDMPVDNAIDAIALKVGVVKKGDELHARGGRSAVIHNMYSNPYVTPKGESWNREGYDHIVENEFLDVVGNPVSTFSIDVDAASYSNVRRYINAGQVPPAHIVRIEELINYFHYEYPDPKGDKPFSITTEISECPWNPQNRLVHVGLQGKRLQIDELPPTSITFLIDVSGSMSPENKLPLLRRSLRLLVDKLRPEDRVAIVVYAGAAGLVLPSTAGDKKETIREAIGRLRSGGSTAGAAGIRLAYQTAEQSFIEDGNNRVILATDGDFNVGVSSKAELIKLIEEKRETGVFLTVLGFGQGNLQDAKMEQLANKGNGHYAYIDNILEARKVLVDELGATLLTIAKDVKIQIEFNPAKVKSYRLVGYENRLLKKEDFDDDTKDAGEIGAGHSVTALYEIVPADGRVADAAEDEYRYMLVSVDPKAYRSSEIMSLKLRYKEPDSDTSKLITQTVKDAKTPFEKASVDFRFSAAVAEFGLLLRDSKFKENSAYDHVLATARAATRAEADELASEFIRLVESCALLAEK